MIELEKLTKSFGRFKALQSIDATFMRGQCVALIGPNGSGKTTLIKSVLGMVVPDSGSIRIDNCLVGSRADYRRKIGYMPQLGRYPEHMTIAQVIDMMRDIRGSEEQDDDLILSFRIADIINKRMGALSGGMRQKVNAALAFLFNPTALILDEPTAGLDPVSSEILKEKIRADHQRGKLVIITSHILSDLDELATDVTYIQDGNLFFQKKIEDLKSDTGEKTLARAIANVMQS